MGKARETKIENGWEWWYCTTCERWHLGNMVAEKENEDAN